MSQRIPKRYTILIACTGRSPLTLSIQPILAITILILSVATPTLWIGKQFYTYSQKNNRLTEQNTELTEQAQDILEQVKVLEAEIDLLQERAGVSQQPNRHRNRHESQGGISIPVDASGLLAAAEAQLPQLVKSFKGEVQPALEKMLRQEDALPKGIPFKAKAEVSSGFGLRPDPFQGRHFELHQGMDFKAPYGTPIYATAPGVVITAGWSKGGYGNHVIVDHGYGYRTLYAHMSETKVSVGTRVNRDRIIGYLGNTGRSSGPHLHYGVYHNDQPIDPKNYLN